LDADAFSSLPAFRLRNDDVGVQVTEIIRAFIDARVAASGVAYTPAAVPPDSGLGDRGCISGSTNRTASDILADPLLGPEDEAGVAVVCDIVVATGPYLGQRIRAVSSDSTDTTVVVYANTSTGEAATADKLWAEDALVALHSEIVNLVRRDTDSLGVSVRPPDEAGRALMSAALAQTVVTPDGTLVVPVAAGFTSPELRSLGITPTTERLVIGVPGGLAANLLTPLGADLLLVAAAGGQFTPPATVPAGREPVDCTFVPCVALTYDDGPSELTPGILDELAKRHASATFFITGERARFNVELLKRTLGEGHLVENHTFSHPNLPRLSPARLRPKSRTPTPPSSPPPEYRRGCFGPPTVNTPTWCCRPRKWQPSCGTSTRSTTRKSPTTSFCLERSICPNRDRSCSSTTSTPTPPARPAPCTTASSTEDSSS
jgi:hypothetical protein